MMKRTILIFLLAFTAFALACNGINQNTNSNKASSVNGELPYTKDVKPVADPEIAVIETEEFGTIKLELYSNVAPKMVARFKELAKEGFYNGTTFHRINPSLGIIQGGDQLSKDDNPANDGTGSSSKPNVPAEFSDIPYETGMLGAARGGAPDSANSQFFIMTQRQPAFDKRYTIFGKVIEGQSNVNTIAGAPTLTGSERPDPKIVVKSITIQKK
jgi:cyclophilin family peptidyl-prolyl cis-trans isomerase